jgi:hypothetical protein
MKVLETYHKSEINDVIIEYINEKSIIFPDKSTSYFDLSELVDAHIMKKSDKEVTKTTLKWVDVAILAMPKEIYFVCIR